MDFNLSSEAPPRHVSWQSPSPRKLRLNFDGSCIQDCQLVGFRLVIRDHYGSSISSYTGPLHGCSALEAELYSLWQGVQKMEELKASGVVIEGDSKVVLNWASGSICPWKFLDKMDRIQHSISDYAFVVSWVPRKANSTADEMARLGLNCNSDSVSRDV